MRNNEFIDFQVLVHGEHNEMGRLKFVKQKHKVYRLYFKSSLTLTPIECLNSWRVSVVPYYATTNLPAIQKQH